MFAVLLQHIRRTTVETYKVRKGHLHLNAQVRLSHAHYSILSGSASAFRALPHKARESFAPYSLKTTRTHSLKVANTRRLRFPRPASRRESGGAPGDDDPGLTADGGLAPGTAAETDVDRFLRDKDLEELTRKTYDAMGLEVREVLARRDLRQLFKAQNTLL
jgi:hypothetical protein